jgi:hypothetical protein
LGPNGSPAQSVALVVKRRVKAAGLEPEQPSGHSLRAGELTATAPAGVEERKSANVSRRNDLPVVRRYVRAAAAVDDIGEASRRGLGNLCCRRLPVLTQVESDLTGRRRRLN